MDGQARPLGRQEPRTRKRPHRRHPRLDHLRLLGHVRGLAHESVRSALRTDADPAHRQARHAALRVGPGRRRRCRGEDGAGQGW